MSNDETQRLVGELMATAKAAHDRIDNLEQNLREDLKGIYSKLEGISGTLNRGKGWASAALLLASAAGGIITLIFNHVLGK